MFSARSQEVREENFMCRVYVTGGGVMEVLQSLRMEIDDEDSSGVV